MIKIGLLGTGFMGQTHSEVYKILSTNLDIKVYGVCDINEDYVKRVSKIHEAKIYMNADEMINDKDIDVIDICLPTYLHYEYAKKAIIAGKSLFIEKPVVLTPEEGNNLIELQNQYKTKIMVGQCIRLWPAYMYLKRIYDTKKYGELKHLAFKRLSPKPTWGFENWYDDINKSGGAILDLHIHDLDYMRYLLGEPSKINVFGNSDHVISVFNYDKDLFVEIESGWDFPKSFPVLVEYRAMFENATVFLRNGDANVYEVSGKQIYVEDDPAGDSNGNPDNKVADLGGYYNELKYFYECLLNNEEILIAPLIEGVKTVKLIYDEIKEGNL